MSFIEAHTRDMKLADLGDVVLIHNQAFPDFFMTLLGSPFLRNYYLTVLEYNKSISLVYVDINDNVTGFSVGFIDADVFYKFLKKKFYRFLSLNM